MKSIERREVLIFNAALEKLTPAEQAAYLDEACGGEEPLRKKVRALLRAYAEAEGFFGPATASSTEGAKSSGELGTPTEILGAVTEQAGATIGRYKLLQKIAEGGMGVVYMAEQEEPVRRKVALKIIKLGMDTKSVIARFEAERQALAMMDHPNIAKVLDGGATDAGRPYFVMELVRGVKITEYCDEAKLSTSERLNLFMQVCQAIQHAHQKAIIHRDIKPSNILVTINDGVPVPKVIDFGIAKATEGRLTDKTLFTQFEALIGTPAYMSPEQAVMTSLDIDTRSDIYSLGVLLYELLAGSTPFDAKELLASGLDAMRQTIREQEPVPPSTRLATLQAEEQTTTAKRRSSDPPRLIHLLKGDLDWIVMKCLEKDRTRRYETANALAMDLKRHLNHELVLARPPSIRYRLQKGFRRNKLVFTAAGMVGSALVLGVVVSSWQAVRATRAGRAAQLERDHAQKAERVATAETQIAQDQRRRADAATLEARQNLYASDMLLAQHVQEDGNLDLALNLLNRHRPAPGKPDLRGWEWRYLWSVCQSDEVATFATNSGSVSHVVMSPDGRLLSSAEWGPARTAVKIWQFPTGQLLATPETNDAAGSVAFSPNGKLLAFGTKSHGLKLWDVEVNQEKTIFPGKYGQAFGSGLVFSPDGSLLAASSGGEPQILLWNIEKKTLSMTFRYVPAPRGRPGLSGRASSLVFLPDGKTLVSGSDDSTICLWSLASGQEIARFTNHTDAVMSLALSANGRTLASAGRDKTIRIWDLAARCQTAVLTNHTRGVTSLALSADEKTLASAGADFLIKLWDTARWQEVSTLRGSMDELYAIALSPDGKALISGAKNGAIKTWKPGPRARADGTLKPPGDARWWWLVNGTLYCYHTSGAISYWNPATLRQKAYYDPPEGLLTNFVWFEATPSGRMVWANKQSEIIVWDPAVRRQLARFPWVATEEKYVTENNVQEKQVTVSPNEKLLVAAAAGKCLTVWDLESRQEIANLPKSAAAVAALSFSPDLHLVAGGNGNGTVEVWDLSRKKLVADWQAHKQMINSVAFMPDGKRLVTVSDDATGKLWDIDSRRELKSFPRTLDAFNSLAISPDGQRIAAGTSDGLIKIWNSSTGQELAALRAGDEKIWRLQFLGPDGNTIISLTDDEARLWHAPSLEEIATAEAKEKTETQRP